ncbi:hypothetical protein ABLG96_07855 [Nakamurella sp. A5-74]|uniref:Uncharacterized protein n=1 Tax=Nakamurella sp. A5-74 TaxID=3158264 RepID=A0AAU8DT41_9ACTN
MPWTSVIVAVLAWVGVVLGKFVGAGAGTYPWLIPAAAVVALVAVAVPGAHRNASACTASVLALVTGIGLLGLA